MTRHASKLLLEGLLAVLLLASALYNYIVNAVVTPLDVVFVVGALLYGANAASGGRLFARFGVARPGTRWLLLGVGFVLGVIAVAVALLRMP